MDRRNFIGVILALGLPLSVIGCGGGDGGSVAPAPSIDNPGGSASADLSAMVVAPAANQSAFISRNTSFELSWPSLAVAPQNVSVNLVRYLEARGGDDRQDIPVAITIQQNGSAPSWTIAAQGPLDAGGVYYLDVRTQLDERRYAFVVDLSRAVDLTTASAVTRGVTISNPGGATSDLSRLTLRWTGDVTGSVNLSEATEFVLEWSTVADAPSSFNVFLIRYEEPRGSSGFSDNEQDVEFQHTAGTSTWTILRQNGVPLDSGTYILEVSVPGSATPLAYAFIVL